MSFFGFKFVFCSSNIQDPHLMAFRIRELLRLNMNELTWNLLPFIPEEEVGEPWDLVRGFNNLKEEKKMVLPGTSLLMPKAESSPAL